MRGRTWSAAALVFCCTVAAWAGALDAAEDAFAKRDFEKAVELAGKVPESSKDHFRAQCLVGDCLLAQEKWADAEERFRALLGEVSDDVPALTGLERALAGGGRPAEGEKVLSRAIALDQRSVPANLALCEIWIARGTDQDLEGACTNLRATLFLDAKHPHTNRLLVETLLRLGHLDEAEKVAEKYGKADEDAATSLYLRGLVLERRDAAAKALELHRKAAKKDPDLREAHARIALLLAASDPSHADAKKTDEARAAARRYRELGGKDAAVLALLPDDER